MLQRLALYSRPPAIFSPWLPKVLGDYRHKQPCPASFFPKNKCFLICLPLADFQNLEMFLIHVFSNFMLVYFCRGHSVFSSHFNSQQAIHSTTIILLSVVKDFLLSPPESSQGLWVFTNGPEHRRAAITDLCWVLPLLALVFHRLDLGPPPYSK